MAGTDASLPVPVDGMPVADDLDLSDGNGALNVPFEMEQLPSQILRVILLIILQYIPMQMQEQTLIIKLMELHLLLMKLLQVLQSLNQKTLMIPGVTGHQFQLPEHRNGAGITLMESAIHHVPV